MKRFKRNPRKYQGGWAGWASLAGAAVSYLASDNAADKQAGATEQASREANQTQLQMYNQSRQDQLPFMNRANAAGNRLDYLLGLSPAPAQKTREQLLTELAPQFTRSGAGGPGPTSYAVPYRIDGNIPDRSGYQYNALTNPSGAATVDYAGLNAAVDAALKRQASQPIDPAYGSLLRNFSSADLDADPVYQSGLKFGLNEGEKALNHQAAATGSLLSGATLKALTRYANDYGSTKANESYNRYNNDTTSQFNRLASVAGLGQQAAGQVGAQGVQVGQNMGDNKLLAGISRASGYASSNNAFQGALNNFYGIAKKNNWFGGTPTPAPAQDETTNAPFSSEYWNT